MSYGNYSFDARIKESIRGYHLKDLYDLSVIEFMMRDIHNRYNVGLFLTERHGECTLKVGDWEEDFIDPVATPGIRVRFRDRTMAHLHLKNDVEECIPAVNNLVKLMEEWGEKSFMAKELSSYKGELEHKIRMESVREEDRDKLDVLTGTFTKDYFESRIKVIDRAGIAPVAIVQANINDCKWYYDNFGEDESDRLIKIVADFLMEAAKPEYVIGRCDGDVFNVVIPMPEDLEAEQYVTAVRNLADKFDDPVLYPSIAFGIAYKENVEENISDKISEAEYEMFINKLDIKNVPGYRDKLEKGKRG
ncbi:MAG: diguanylate cyclase [Lachnospiraceae bacterium]|nr:diguanylate cyclase [Lachnospiraceae bacterium]MBR4992964.1 diguanylate cyclase [Lachnospiraceae bacterium]